MAEHKEIDCRSGHPYPEDRQGIWPTRIRAEPTMVENEYCARLIVVAHEQALDETIRTLEMVEKYGLNALQPVLDQMRKKRAILRKPSHG